MTWTKFTLLLVGAYGLYYGFNILMDFLRQTRTEVKGKVTSLVLGDDLKPVIVDEADFSSPAPTDEPPNLNGAASPAENEVQPSGVTNEPVPKQQPESGGVSISELLKLYRNKAILQSAKYDFSVS